MSKMKDRWDDTIKVVNADGEYVGVTFIETPYDDSRYTDMEREAAMTRKFIKKLKKALAEAEGA